MKFQTTVAALVATAVFALVRIESRAATIVQSGPAIAISISSPNDPYMGIAGTVVGSDVGQHSDVMAQGYPENLNNDNTPNPFVVGANQIWIEKLQFLGTTPIDLVLHVTAGPPGSNASEYGLILGSVPFAGAATSIINSSGATWSGFQIAAGVNVAGVLQPLNGLDFDTPPNVQDSTPSSNTFSLFQNLGSKINFLNASVPSNATEGSPGDAHHFNVTASLDIPNAESDYDLTLRLSPLLASTQGQSPDNPFLPNSPSDPETGAFVFTGATRARWYDPPAFGFDFVMDSGSLFTVVDLPDDFLDSIDLYVDGDFLTTLTGGSPAYHFGGGGVSSFELIGIDPPVDSDNPSAFPVFLDFNTDTASFHMIPLDASAAVPEPSTLIVFGIGLACIASARAVRRKLV